jgi:hypothetical protein
MAWESYRFGATAAPVERFAKRVRLIGNPTIPALVLTVEERFEPLLTAMVRTPHNHDVEKTVRIEIGKLNVALCDRLAVADLKMLVGASHNGDVNVVMVVAESIFLSDLNCDQWSVALDRSDDTEKVTNGSDSFSRSFDSARRA